MRSVISFAILALVASVIVPRYASQMHAGAAAPSLLTAQPAAPSDTSPSNSRSVVIPPGATDISRSKAASTAAASISWSTPAPR